MVRQGARATHGQCHRALTSSYRSLALLLLLGCRQSKPEPRPVVVAVASADAAPPLVMKKRTGKTDVTFVVVSDTHLGYAEIEKDNAKLIARLNGIAGRAYPGAIGGKVDPPRGVVITGDLTEWGQPHEWARFVEMYGLTGTEGPLKLPVFEMVGNHDKVARGPWVADQVAARHGGGRFYSWDWDDVHLLALGEAPDDDGLAFLEKDLAQVAPDVPIVVFFHLALLGPWSTDNWFTDVYKERFYRLIDHHNVVAIFHGHHHATGHYAWHGIDVWKPGAVKNDAHTFAVVHVTDSAWTLGSYDWEQEAWGQTYVKMLRPPLTPARK